MKNKKNNTKLPKYKFGSFIDNPATDLYENQIALVKASKEAGNDAWSSGLKIFGNLAQQVGGSMMNSKNASTTTPGGDTASTEGFSGVMNNFMSNNKGDVESGLGLMGAFSQFLAMGGVVPGTQVEVEGQEVGETPTGQLLDFQGPSHENGGIPISLPKGTEIYSKRIKIDGVSMADRKKKRENKTITLEDLFSKTNDALTKNSLTRTKSNNEIEETNDNKIQAVVKQLLDKTEGVKKHAYGDTVGEPNDPLAQFLAMIQNNGMLTGNTYGGFGNKTSVPSTQTDTGASNYLEGTVKANPGTNSVNTDNGDAFSNLFGGATFGDAIGLTGNLKSTFGPMNNTKANRAGDTPNINAFADYGKEGLDVLDTSKQYVNQIRDQKLKDLDLARASSVRRNSNSTRSVNTNRALNLATDAQINNAEEQTYNSFAESILGILGQQAGMENQQDSVVMQGEAQRDLADRQDRDNYFSQLAEDISTMGTGLQETGKDINQIKQNQVIMKLLQGLSKYGITVDKQGNLSNPTK